MKQFIPFILGLVLVSGHGNQQYPSEQVNSLHGPSTADCATCLARLDFLEDRLEDLEDALHVMKRDSTNQPLIADVQKQADIINRSRSYKSNGDTIYDSGRKCVVSGYENQIFFEDCNVHIFSQLENRPGNGLGNLIVGNNECPPGQTCDPRFPGDDGVESHNIRQGFP